MGMFDPSIHFFFCEREGRGDQVVSIGHPHFRNEVEASIGVQ
jgi:hypothetical protein